MIFKKPIIKETELVLYNKNPNKLFSKRHIHTIPVSPTNNEKLLFHIFKKQTTVANLNQ